MIFPSLDISKKIQILQNYQLKNKNIFDYSNINSLDRENNIIKNFVKSTKVLNIIWREFYKEIFFKKSY